jgi:Pyridoxamine 5'-phosphate oxidase
MATWNEVAAATPELAQAVQAAFDAHKHKALATLRADGSPRITGIETGFFNGQLWLGMMGGSRKALDLQRDPRLALHSGMVDTTLTGGDARISGRGEEITDEETIRTWMEAVSAESGVDPPEPFHLFRVDVSEVVLVRIGDPADHLVIESWREDGGFRRIERR